MLDKALPYLVSNEIDDLETLHSLSKDDLLGLGMKLGTVMKIMKGRN